MNDVISFFTSLESLVLHFVHDHLLLAPVLLLLIEEAGVPLPVSGDIILLYVGYEVSNRLIPYPLTFVLFVIAVVIGSSLLYLLSRRYGHQIVVKFGKYIDLDEKKLLRIESLFKKYGPWVIIFGRQIPGFRVAITVVAGISKVKYKTFLFSNFISVCLWIAMYLWLGKQFGPGVINLFQKHHSYFMLLLIPLCIGSVLFFLRIKKAGKPLKLGKTK